MRCGRCDDPVLNAPQWRMIAASRKKTDRRDADWIRAPN